MPQPKPLAYFNGGFVSQAEARLTLHDAGFVWGATVTDLCRTFGRRPFRLADHLRRFRRSCEIACIPQSVSDGELTAVADRLVEHDAALPPPDGDLAVVFFATPGPIGFYLGEPGGAVTLEREPSAGRLDIVGWGKLEACGELASICVGALAGLRLIQWACGWARKKQ